MRHMKTLLTFSLLIACCHSFPLAAALLEFEQAYDDISESRWKIKSLNAELAAKQAEYRQASAYPNPLFFVGVETNGGGFTCNQGELDIEVTQLIELGGKRCARRRVAAANQWTTAWELEAAKVELYVDLLHAFIDMAHVQEMLALTIAQQNIAHESHECCHLQCTSGRASTLEVKKASGALYQANIAAGRQKLAYERAKSRLLSIGNGCFQEFEGVFFPLHQLMPLPSLEALVAQMPKMPVLAKAGAEIARASDLVALARSERIPDVALEVGISMQQRWRTPSVNVGVTIPLPFFDSGSANVCRATYQQEQAVYDQLELASDLKSTLMLLFAEAEQAQEEAIAFEQQVIPCAEEAFALATAGYEEGKFNIISLLEARTNLFIAKQQQLQALADYHHKRAELLKYKTDFCKSLNYRE